MHRVELKDNFCYFLYSLAVSSFLMHRVELKGSFLMSFTFMITQFLMHRVELKVTKDLYKKLINRVPNAPCGVERSLGEYTEV